MLTDHTRIPLAGTFVSPDHLTLHRLDLRPAGDDRRADAGGLTGLAVDVETTGLESAKHGIIELSARPFRWNRDGEIVWIGASSSWLEDPGEALSPTIARLTGLTDKDLRGRAIDDGAVARLVRSVDVVCAFNAGFDRPFFEARFPKLRGMPWACGLKEVDWRRRRFDGSGRSLGWLLAQAGFFHGAHRAGNDVDALIAMLHHIDGDGRTACAEMVETASAPCWRFRAVGAHFDAKDDLKARNYRWDGTAKVWWREVADADRVDEAAWLDETVYVPWRRPLLAGPAVDEVTWFTRHG